ncbi:MAG: glycosyl transferase family 1 [Sulfitobacter sp.]|jgi:mannosyltransferase|nr:glycosyl transferase family 1 [Roseobacter sp.]PHR06265.1 MAG: glycosyl transferase family 1 [Sulfitobacter sp.]|tara:strand:+ start:6793 stop:7854 length:1062 start_codon:yes stop_codon:yes gene_type:complete
MTHPLAQTDVIAPNFKRRLSGVTATVMRLVPLQARSISIVATGPVVPEDVPQVPLLSLLTMSRRGPSGWRVWHARRNVEMLGGLALRYVLGKRLKLMFTSASQRRQTGLTRWLIRRMDVVVATSDRTNAYLENPGHVIMHGIDTEGFSPSPDRAALRADLKLPVTATLVGCYGRIRAQKGTDAFVEAMLPVLRANPEVVALVMGRATEKYEAFEQGLKERVRAEAMQDRVLFLPEVPVGDMADFYRVLDLYVAPQRWEGFGLTPIEAMACGVPVVATRVGAFEKLVVQDTTGLLVDADDIPALSDAINSALSDRDRLANWAVAGRSYVMSDFSIEREAAALVKIYRRLLKAEG